MTKPYIIVHMMTSIDGRIDCGMTLNLMAIVNIIQLYQHLRHQLE